MNPRNFFEVCEAWSHAVLDAEYLGAASLAEGTHDDTTKAAAHHKNASNKLGKPSSKTHNNFRDSRVGEYLNRRVRELLLHKAGGDGQLEGEEAQDSVAVGSPEENGRASNMTQQRQPDPGMMGYLERKQCVLEGCDDLRGVSLAGYGVYEELDGGDIQIPGGFSRVIDALARKVKAKYYLVHIMVDSSYERTETL